MRPQALRQDNQTSDFLLRRPRGRARRQHPQPFQAGTSAGSFSRSACALEQSAQGGSQSSTGAPVGGHRRAYHQSPVPKQRPRPHTTSRAPHPRTARFDAHLPNCLLLARPRRRSSAVIHACASHMHTNEQEQHMCPDIKLLTYNTPTVVFKLRIALRSHSVRYIADSTF